jgi:hypothetical protein
LRLHDGPQRFITTPRVVTQHVANQTTIVLDCVSVIVWIEGHDFDVGSCRKAVANLVREVICAGERAVRCVIERAVLVERQRAVTGSSYQSRFERLRRTRPIVS